MQRHAVFEVDRLLADVVITDPRFERVAAAGVALLEIGRFQNQNCSAHPVVDLAVHRDHTGFIENDGGWFLFPAVNGRDRIAWFWNTKKRCDKCRRGLGSRPRCRPE